MKKIIRQYLKQILILILIIALVAILNNIFVKSSIRGDYDTITVGITKGADAREVKKYLVNAFKEEFDFKKKLDVEAVGSFQTEFRIKSNTIVEEERDFIKIELEKEYGEVGVSVITQNPEANYRVDIIMYGLYFLIIAVLGFGAVYFLNIIPMEEEVNVKNIKKRREEIIEEENKRIAKEKKQKAKKDKVKKDKIKKDKVKKDKDKKDKVKKDKKDKDKKDKVKKDKVKKDKTKSKKN